MDTTQETLNQAGSIWVVTTSSWTGTEKLAPEDIDKDPSEIPEIFKLGSKYIIPHDVRLKLQGTPQRVRAFMNTVGYQFLKEIKSAWFVPDKYLLTAKEGLEKIRQARMEVVEEVIARMPEIKAQMIEQYPVLARVEWPSDEDIRSKFKIKWIVFEIKGVSTSKADPETLLEAKRQFQADLQAEYKNYISEILKEAHLAIIETCEEISKRILDTGDAVTKATLNKPRKIIEKYMMVAELFDMDDIKAKVDEVRRVVESVDSITIKDDWEIAKDFAESLRQLGDDIGDLSGLSSDGRVKRRIKFEKAA